MLRDRPRPLPWKGETNTNTISNIETGRFGGETLRAKSFAVEQGARRTIVEKEKNLVARLRKESNGVTVNLNPWPTMREAADEIEKLRAEIVRLEAMKQQPS